MAEKGIIVDDAVSGESVACRDAVKVDDESNSRVIQLTDRAARAVEYQREYITRAEVSSSDSLIIDPLPSNIRDSLVDVSDAESCIVWAVVTSTTSSSTDAKIYITPIIASDTVPPTAPVAVTLLPPFQLLPVYPAKDSTNMLEDTDRIKLSSYTALTIVHSFPTLGAKNIGFHITFSGSTTGLSVDLYAEPGSSAGRNTAMDQDVLGGNWGESFGKPMDP